jgi:carbon-monoxide dehydrogenase large subunit
VLRLEARDRRRQAAIDAADVVVTRRYYQPRLIPNAIEPRGVLAQVGPAGDVTLWSATQTPHIIRFVYSSCSASPSRRSA